MNPAEYAAMFAVEDRHWWYVAVRREVERWLAGLRPPPGRPLRLLDAGCGTGGLLANLRTPAWKAGIDAAAEGVRLARSRGLSALVRGSVSALPFAEESFDAVISIDVLCHSRVDEEQAIAESLRVLRPGGLFLVQVPAFDFLRGEHDAAVWTKRRYRRREVADLLSRSGFAPRRAAYRNAILFPAAVLARLARRGEVRREVARSDVRHVPATVNALLTGVLAFERWLGWRFPFGLSVFCVAEKPPLGRGSIRAPEALAAGRRHAG